MYQTHQQKETWLTADQIGSTYSPQKGWDLFRKHDLKQTPTITKGFTGV